MDKFKFTCNFKDCGAKFKTRLEFVKHDKEVHETVYGNCEICKQEFTIPNLKGHNIDYHVKCSRKCKICGFESVSKSSLAKHYKKAHREVVGYIERSPKDMSKERGDFKLAPIEEVKRKLQEVGPSIFANYKLLENSFSIHAYDESLRLSRWSIHVLKRSKPIEDIIVADRLYKRDHRVTSQLTEAGLKSIHASHCGHYVPAADCCKNKVCLEESYLLSNLGPQHIAVNEGAWQVIEGETRGLVKKYFDECVVICGPVIDEDTEGDIVPGGYELKNPISWFKIIIMYRHNAPICYTCYNVPNKAIYEYFLQWRVELSIINEATKLKFLENLTQIPAIGSIEYAKIIHKCPKTYCYKCFLTSDDLIEHSKVHEGEFQCTQCSQLFKDKNLFEEHKLSHEVKKCPHCDYTSFATSNLNNHIKEVHAKVRNHICKVCNKGFYSPSDLERHENVHTGAKPFKCKICGQGFPNSSNLARHEKLHSKPPKPIIPTPYKCSKCGKGYAWSQNARRHENSCTAQAPAAPSTSFTKRAKEPTFPDFDDDEDMNDFKKPKKF